MNADFKLAMMTPEETIKYLATAITQPSRMLYEQLREALIEQHGYSTFRDLQCDAFFFALYN